MNRDKVLAAMCVPAIAFAFVVGALGLHRGYGLARAVITVTLAMWIVFGILQITPFLPRLSHNIRGALALGVTALMTVEIVRVIRIMAKEGFAVGDLIVLVLNTLIFGYIFAWGLSLVGATPGGALLRAAVRANKTDHKKALRLATTTTRLYRKWDKAWELKASITFEIEGMDAQIRVLKEGLRHCPRSEDIRGSLVSSLYANGSAGESFAQLDEYKDRFPYSGRPNFFEALNAMEDQDWDKARQKLEEARRKAKKGNDEDGLIQVAWGIARYPHHFDMAIAQEVLESAIHLDPGNPESLVMLGILLETNQPTRSASLLDQARQALKNRGSDTSFDDYLAYQRSLFGPNMG